MTGKPSVPIVIDVYEPTIPVLSRVVQTVPSEPQGVEQEALHCDATDRRGTH